MANFAHFTHSYQKLSADLYSACQPDTVDKPTLVLLNHALAQSLLTADSDLHKSNISNNKSINRGDNRSNNSNNKLDRAKVANELCKLFAIDNSTLNLEQDVEQQPKLDYEQQLAQVFSGNQPFVGCQPIAQAYAGHQFGHLNMLGDGRAHLLAELVTASNANSHTNSLPDKHLDIQLKGSGRTPYSRGGDGKASLAPMLREYLISEAMHALGIASSRSLAVVATGEQVYRNGLEQGAILTRVASSHLRVGTFVYASMLAYEDEDTQILAELVDYAYKRHYPAHNLASQEQTGKKSTEQQALALLENVMQRQAQLVAEWHKVGFIHGVLNTDNVTISGETIDYGPCAFLEHYNLAQVFSSIDRQGRYAFGNQLSIMWWNMARFAEALLPVIQDDGGTGDNTSGNKNSTKHSDKNGAKHNEEKNDAVAKVTALVNQFGDMYQAAWSPMLCAKVGLEDNADNFAFAESLLRLLQERQLDYTNTFVSLTQLAKTLLTVDGDMNGDDIDGDDKDSNVDNLASLATAHGLVIESIKQSTDSAMLTWLRQWQAKLNKQSADSKADGSYSVSFDPVVFDPVAVMQQNNPRVIPRNHLVEKALFSATNNQHDDESDNMTFFNELLAVLQAPHDYSEFNESNKNNTSSKSNNSNSNPEHGKTAFNIFTTPASSDWTANYQTFCGT